MDFLSYITSNASPMYIILTIGFAIFIALLFGLSKRKGSKIFIILVSIICIVVAGVINIYLFIYKGVFSGFLINFGILEVVIISLFLFIALNVLIFLCLNHFEKDNFLKILIIFLFCICTALFAIVSKNFLAIFVSFSIFVLGIFQLVSSLNKGIEESYYLIKLFLNSFLSLLLLFLGISFMYAFTDFKNVSQIMESVELTSPFVSISLIFIISGVFLYLFMYPLQGNYLKFLKRSDKASPAVVWFFYLPMGFIILFKFKNLIYNFINSSDILLAILILASVTVIGACIGALSTKNIRRILSYLFLSIMSLSFFIFVLFAGDIIDIQKLEYVIFYNIISLIISFIPIWLIFSHMEDSIKDLNGFMQNNKYIGVNVFIALLSLLGMFGTSGFLLRYYFLESFIKNINEGTFTNWGITRIAIFSLMVVSFLLIFAIVLLLIINIFKSSNKVKSYNFPKSYYAYITFFTILIIGIGILGLLEIFEIMVLNDFSLINLNIS